MAPLLLGDEAGASGEKTPGGTGPPTGAAWTMPPAEGALSSSIAPMVESGAPADAEEETGAMVLSRASAHEKRPVRAVKTRTRTATRRAIFGVCCVRVIGRKPCYGLGSRRAKLLQVFSLGGRKGMR